jgi:uncharacterized membrane protein (DUF373 family)
MYWFVLFHGARTARNVLLAATSFEFQASHCRYFILLVLVELFRLLIIYLQEKRVSIGVAVEVCIVSVLREVIVRGVLETPWVQILSTGVFLLVLGVLLVVRVWLPPTFEGIDPERRLASRNRKFSEPETSSDPVAVNSKFNSHPRFEILDKTRR